MTNLVGSLELPHWLMLVGALLVIAGCIGLAISRKRAAEIDDEGVNESSPEPPPQMSPLPDLLDSRRRSERKQPEQ
jgi:hypothetical protein